MNKLIVISGCSGGGKSTLISEISRHGYSVMPEVGREIYKAELRNKVDVTTWENQIRIARLIIEKSVAAYHEAASMTKVKEQTIFFDRCFLECVSFFQHLKNEESKKYDNLISDLRYYPTIFLTPPWEEIYRQDDERKHSFEDGVAEYEQLLVSYARYGYQIVEIPKLSVKKRYEFIISSLRS